jgi:hypothetical protein
MLFRNTEGKLIELNRYDYTSDHIYYKKILKIKNLLNNVPKETTYSNNLIQNAILSKTDLQNSSTK